MSRPRAIGSADVVLVTVLAAGLGLSLIVWLWGQLAGLVFGGGWPHVAPGQVPGVLERLPVQVRAAGGRLAARPCDATYRERPASTCCWRRSRSGCSALRAARSR